MAENTWHVMPRMINTVQKDKTTRKDLRGNEVVPEENALGMRGIDL